MKHTLYLIVIVLFLTQACKKAHTSVDQSTDHSLIESAQLFFQEHLEHQTPVLNANTRITAGKRPYWPAAYTVNSSKGILVVVPVIYQKNLVVKTNFSGKRVMALNYLTKLVMYKNDNGFYAQLATYFPDSACNTTPNGAFSGLIFSETWLGQPIAKYKLAGGIALTQTEAPLENQTPKTHVASTDKKSTGLFGTCTTIFGFNYSADDPSESFSWSEPGGCTYSFIPDYPTTPVPPPIDLSKLFGRPLLPSLITIAPPTNAIANVQEYIKCFSNYGGSDHSYQVAIYVDQPDPGTREAWNVSPIGAAGSSAGTNPVDVGHVFLVLTENFGNYNIVRNVGFYPKSNVFPWSSTAQGQLNNDDGHGYNISLTIAVDNGQFFNILNYISQGNNAGYMYDLNTNNCTSFAIHALAAGSVSVPATVGSWPDGGFGYNPGDLGEDIRNMPLTSNMTRNTSYNDHPNKYTCN